ncbi:hypothetical protein QVD17_41595 [Tagetes erecta]|uniref:Secreted protein n=1 Tax=Tagetes erecta TaxID=13708 RepID=A0AAD8JPJ4_TARER|nr:hypothetical protein QVD17_41595 [Tagetes erecta]
MTFRSLCILFHMSTSVVLLQYPSVGSFMKFKDLSETSSSHGGTGVTSAGAVPVPQLPKLQENVCNSMFFC